MRENFGEISKREFFFFFAFKWLIKYKSIRGTKLRASKQKSQLESEY